MDEKRVQKTADELVVGDWLAADQLVDGPAEVLHTLTYRGDDGSPHTHLVIRELGARAPYADVVYGLGLMTLATEAELEALRGSAERAQKIADIRALADWLEANPDVPMETYLHEQVGLHGDAAEDVAKVRALGAKFKVEVRDDLDDRTSVCFKVGSLEYKVIAWHYNGRPAESAPEPIAEHYEVRGWKDGGPGGCGVACACGVTYNGFDSLAEASKILAQHIADPSGQDYGRADTAEQDDPTPVSGARIEPHVGAVTEKGLVDETPAEDVHMDFLDGRSLCGLAATTPHTGSLVWSEVTCPDCVKDGC